MDRRVHKPMVTPLRSIGLAIALAASLGAGSASAAPSPGAAAVIAAASRAMGADALNAIKLYGPAADFQVGQSSRVDGPWPRRNLSDYVETLDFTRPAARATAVTWSVPIAGGVAAQGAYNLTVTPDNPAWAQQLEIWTSPWGFLKGAARNDAVLTATTLSGRRYRVLTWMTPQKSAAGLNYKVVGFIGPDNLVAGVETQVENPVLGDLSVERRYSDYRAAGGVMYPTTIGERRAGRPTFEAQILGVEVNPGDIGRLLAAPPAPPPPPYAGPASEKLADGVYRINGSYNALAVEFRDYIVLFEPGPQSEARASAVIAETKRVIPGKPIRYGVISHHHFDHISGLSAAVAEGVTIVMPRVDEAYLRRVLAAPRTLAPDLIAKSGKKPVIEAFDGDKRVFQDATRTFEIYVLRDLPHADGMVVGWLPKEKIMVYADLFFIGSPNYKPATPPPVNTQVFLAELERLKLEPERLLSIHSFNPDRLATMEDIRAAGRGAPGQ